MIVKIQRPLMSSEPEPKVLVYNRGRSFYAQLPFTSAIAALFDDGSLKVYHRAKVKGSTLLIGERVKDQDF